MSPQSASQDRSLRHTWSLVLPVVLACIAWFLYQRNYGLHPTVFADEWYYSKMARLTPLPEAIVPSYLYLWMFGASAACGPGFLECVRGGNLVLFLAASPFIYGITRRYASGLVAFSVAVLSALAPLNVYTAYFMPESTYYFGFCVLSWVALTRTHWHPLALALGTGAILGVMSLIKVHAVFLLPALLPYLLYLSWHRGGPWFLRGVTMMAAAGVATVAIKFGLGWLLADEAGLSLLGPFYQGAVNGGAGSNRFRLLAPAFVNGRGHLMALAMLYGVPLAILVHGLCTRALRHRGEARNLLHLYALLMLGAAAGLTILYTATLDAPGSKEILRLHLRYYSFVFPLLCVVAAAAITVPAARSAPGAQAQAPRLPWLRWAVALLLGALLVGALLRLYGYALNIVDGPEVAGIDLAGIPGRLLIGLQMFLLLLWAARVRAAPLLFVFIAMPAAIMAAQQGAGTNLERHRPPGQADLAGKFMRDTVPYEDRGKIVVAGADMTQVMRVQFHLDHPDSVAVQLENADPIAEYQMPVSKKWMVLLGANPLPASVTPIVRNPHYAIVRLPEPEQTVGVVKMSTEPDPRFVSSLEGLSHAEAWGRWSDAGKVVIHFAQPLPRRVGIILNARGYDVNATLPFTAHLGGVEKQFRVGWHLQEVGMHFDTDGSARTLVIDIPQPVSPAERGNPGDPRKLGIGIAEITVTDGTRPAQAAR